MSDATFPPTPLTPQQRAARVTAAFYEAKVLHIHDVQRLTGLSRRAAYDLLDGLSACGGIPIAPVDEVKTQWRLLEKHPAGAARELAERPGFRLHPNTRAQLAFWLAQRGEMRAGEMARRSGLTVAQVRWLLRKMRRGGLPIVEERDMWTAKNEG